MTFKDMRDIEREAKVRKKEEFKDELTEDIDDVMKKVLFNLKKGSDKSKQEKKKKEGILMKLAKIILSIAVFLFVINFFIFNVWLMKYFIKSFIG